MANEVRDGDPLSALLPAVTGRRDAPLPLALNPRACRLSTDANMAAPTAREVRSTACRPRMTGLLTTQQQDFPRQAVRTG
jgi:hypothetical protein